MKILTPSLLEDFGLDVVMVTWFVHPIAPLGIVLIMVKNQSCCNFHLVWMILTVFYVQNFVLVSFAMHVETAHQFIFIHIIISVNPTSTAN